MPLPASSCDRLLRVWLLLSSQFLSSIILALDFVVTLSSTPQLLPTFQPFFSRTCQLEPHSAASSPFPSFTALLWLLRTLFLQVDMLRTHHPL